MSRKHCRRRVIVPVPPRGLRPTLDPATLRDLSLVHLVNLDAIATGTADEAMLWQVVGGCLTWHRVAEVLRAHLAEMGEQLEMLADVIERYGRTGKILFTGPEYQLAKQGVQVMDELAAVVDKATAIAAAQWSEARVNAMAAGHRSA